MIPYHQLIGPEDAPHLAFVIHGVLGAGHNFRSFVKKLSDARPEYRFALLDLRYHGRSTGALPPHSLESCADDLFELADHLGQHPRAVIGHSLGGKVALAFGRRHLEEVEGHRVADDAAFDALEQVWALDSDPGAQDPGESHQVIKVLGALKKNRGPFPSRTAAVDAIVGEGLSTGLANWLATNLKRERLDAGERFTWQLQLNEIDELLANYFALDMWPFIEGVAKEDPKLSPLKFELLVAMESDRWSGSMLTRAEGLDDGGNVSVHQLQNSGHWVHVDNPEGLLEILKTYLV